MTLLAVAELALWQACEAPELEANPAAHLALLTE